MKQKACIDELAIFGFAPTFEEVLHVGRPNIPDPQRVADRVYDLLNRRWLTNNGPLVKEFEQQVAHRIGCRHCIAMCNGTIALEIAIRGLGLTGEVIVPSFTFVATVHALQWQEITPVFCEVDPQTHTLNPDHVETLITERTTGIIGVHTWGSPCAVERLAAIADAHRLVLLYDAAHAFGCLYRGESIGNFGDAEVFSFHATKVLNTFEGGAVVTNDDDLAHRVRLMKNFGFAGRDMVIHLGSNGKMNEASAAMGLESLGELDRFIRVNRRNLAQYRTGLAGIEGLTLFERDDASSNCHYMVVEVDPSRCALSRDDLMVVLHAEGVLARRYFYPGSHRMEPYVSKYPGVHLPLTEALTDRVMVLPTGTAVSEVEISAICHLVRLACQHGETIAQQLRFLKGD